MLKTSLIAAVLLFSYGLCFAQDQNKEEPYIIGNSDQLSVTFWQQPELDREVRVGENGMISLPVIGEIKAAGMTTTDLSKRIIQQMSIYNTPVSQATVTVIAYNSRSVVVAGQIQAPGTFRYERIPDIWQVILDAGGPTAAADLTRVTIIRKSGDKSNVIDIDLYKIIKDGDLTRAPKLMAGDLVNVPSSNFGTPLVLSAEPNFQGRNIFFIFGQVNNQGPQNLEEGIDVLDAISIAQGITADADLKNVRVIVKDSKLSSVLRIDLDKYTKNGGPRLTLRPEDTIIVPAKREGIFSSALSIVGTVTPILGALGTMILLIRQ